MLQKEDEMVRVKKMIWYKLGVKKYQKREVEAKTYNAE